MSENLNSSVLESEQHNFDSDSNLETMVAVENVSMEYRMASEQLNSLKEYAIKIAKRELEFESFKAVDSVSFEVKKGDVFGIVGTNGSGKSTLLKIIAGVLEPTEGLCSINGTIAPLIELGAGFDPDLTASENIYLNGALLGYPKTFIDEKFDDIVAFAEVEKFLDMPIKNYSSGMVARIAFAIATVVIPDILIVDEVLSVGDFMFQRKCEDRINELINDHGVTVLIVSHSNEQIERMCNKVIWIESGHTKMMGDASFVCRAYQALGGRSGDVKSEQRIFRSLKKLDKEPHFPYMTLKGDDIYSASIKAAIKVFDKTIIDTVVLTNGLTHINSIIAAPLAGSMNAPIIPIKIDDIPDTVESYLYDTKPKKILMIDCGSHTIDPLNQLRKLPWKPEVIDFDNDGNPFTLSIDVYNYGLSHGFWNDEIALIDFECNSESFAFAPYLYRQACPVFITSYGTTIHIDKFTKLTSLESVKKAYVIGEDIKDEIFETLNNKTIESKVFSEAKGYENCLAICNWLFDQNDFFSTDSLCIGSMHLNNWQDLLPGITYAGKNGFALLLEDPTNLDSIVSCLSFIADNKTVIREIDFIGNESSLAPLDKDLLYNELTLDNKS